jgi:hypothetical protein
MKKIYACPDCEQKDNQIKVLEMNIAILKGELEQIENLAKLSGAMDKGVK